MPIFRLISHIECRSLCQNDPGRGATSAGRQKVAILDFQDGRHVISISANMSASKPLRRSILVSKYTFSESVNSLESLQIALDD